MLASSIKHRWLVWWVSMAALMLVSSCGQAPSGPLKNEWRIFPGHVEPFTFGPFKDARPCWIYLPPGYATSARRYPTLYFLDGNLAFDGNSGMHANRICDDLIRRGEIEPIIVIAIASPSGNQRFFDLTPWVDEYTDWQPNGGGDFFLRAIRDTLKPEIDRRYRTLPNAANTAITGVSLGGLMAVYAGYAYDSTFAKVAGLSPTYSYDYPRMYDFARDRPLRPNLIRFYQDTGTPRDNYIGEMERIALDQGFRLGVNFMSVTVPRVGHSVYDWEKRLPGMLRFLFGT